VIVTDGEGYAVAVCYRCERFGELNAAHFFLRIPKVYELLTVGRVGPSHEQSMLVGMVFGEVARRDLSSRRENRMNVSAAIVYSVNSGRSLLDAFVVAQNILRTLLYDDRVSVFFDGKAGPASA